MPRKISDGLLQTIAVRVVTGMIAEVSADLDRNAVAKQASRNLWERELAALPAFERENVLRGIVLAAYTRLVQLQRGEASHAEKA